MAEMGFHKLLDNGMSFTTYLSFEEFKSIRDSIPMDQRQSDIRPVVALIAAKWLTETIRRHCGTPALARKTKMRMSEDAIKNRMRGPKKIVMGA